ncbi:ABC transporter ATP-binding protein [bacterium]|jgi:sulfonate transport system ATP-binding protein|nr:ABC transporter ATP-binding protein [bacterium]
MITIDIKEKFFKDIKILENIKIFVNEGEFLSIIGPSGCGKTTLLNIASSLDKDFKGKVNISSSNIGFVFQDHRLIPWLTIKENLLIISKDKDINQINELLKLVGLNDILDVYPKNLSGGMSRRVSFVRAFINKPKVIFLDEPFISLDYPTATALKKDFLTLCKKFNTTVILVTHDLSEAIYLSNRILFFSKNPANQILEYENSNNQEFNLKKIDELKNQILETYPNILEGFLCKRLF